MDNFGFEFCGKIWVVFVVALAGIERGKGTREKRLERALSEGKKNDGGVTMLRGLGPNMNFRDLIGQF